MSPFQLCIALNREISNNDYRKEITSSDLVYWLNKAISEIVDSSYKEGPEKTEFNRSILKRLFRYYTTSTVTPSPEEFNNSVEADLSSLDIRYILNDWVNIDFEGEVSRQDVTETTLDNYNVHLKDPFSEHLYKDASASPLRMFINDKVVLVHDGTYSIPTYFINYLTNPTLLNLSSPTDTSEYEDLPVKTHPTIVTRAARMALENEGNRRYATYINEDNKK